MQLMERAGEGGADGGPDGAQGDGVGNEGSLQTPLACSTRRPELQRPNLKATLGSLALGDNSGHFQGAVLFLLFKKKVALLLGPIGALTDS